MTRLFKPSSPSVSRDYLLDMRHYVYRHFDDEGQALYVGCSKDVHARFKQHMFDRTYWAKAVASTKVTVHSGRDAGWDVEKQEIHRLEPLHNSEVYLMDYPKWGQHNFLKHGYALALDQINGTVNPRSGLGKLHGYYREKFGRDLFEDLGSVPLGERRSQPDLELAFRYLEIEHPFEHLLDRVPGLSA